MNNWQDEYIPASAAIGCKLIKLEQYSSDAYESVSETRFYQSLILYDFAASVVFSCKQWLLTLQIHIYIDAQQKQWV